MTRVVAESELPAELTPFAAVEVAYPAELARVHDALRRGLPVLVECDKELAPYLRHALCARLEADGARCTLLDPSAGGEGGSLAAQVREATRGEAEAQRIIVLPHLDLLVDGDGALTPEARPIVPLLYEHPETCWLGFKDAAAPLPAALEGLFARRERILGVARERLRHLVTREEARRLGKGAGIDVYALHKHVSGVNAVRLRRLLAALDGAGAIDALREATLGGLPLPSVDLDADIGGYPAVKERIRRGLLEVLLRRDGIDGEELRRAEGLLPRGMILWGPHGTGKTLFARAIASALRAGLASVSGVELRALRPAQAAERLRALFVRARQAAPAVVLVEGLEAITPRRDGSGEPSVITALLAEMDALLPEELVFVVATTSAMEAVDPALLRPGRFELDAFVGPPDAADRRAILEVYDRRFGLGLSPAALDYAVERTGDPLLAGGGPMSGDHLQALARGLARHRMRDGASGPTDSAAVERVLTEMLGRARLSDEEAELFAIHEAGHALTALILGQRVDRLVLAGDIGGAVAAGALAAIRRGTVSQTSLTDALCVLLAGREAEAELRGEVSALGARDLTLASSLARTLCGELGMGPGIFPTGGSETMRAGVDLAARDMLKLEQERARQLLEEQRAALLALTQALQRREVLDREALAELVKFET